MISNVAKKFEDFSPSEVIALLEANDIKNLSNVIMHNKFGG